ncbi:MAG: wax ester/triacylglycerol synthase family O-acyltransferase [Acidimicrobiales bacterium]
MERLSGLDAGFLYMETPTLLMHTLKLAVLEPAPGVDELPIAWVREQIGERLGLLPPFRRRLVEVPFGFHHPVWIEDPSFDLEYHVRSATVPAPGGRLELDRKVAELASRPLDRGRPLWELYLLDGLASGHVAVLVKIHHAAADGVAASALLANVMTAITDDDDAPPAAGPWSPERVPSDLQLLWDAFVDHLRQLGHLPRLLARTTRSLAALVQHRRRGAGPATPRPILDVPRTPFNAALTPHRSFATVTLPLAPLREVKAAFGVTLNDVVLAVVSGALRSWLADTGDLPGRSLVAGVPVSTDRPDEVRRLGGNKVSNLFTSLATDVADPAARVAAIHHVTAEAKVVQNLLGADMMGSWVQYTPPRPYAWFMRQYSRFALADRHRPPINLVVSNVPGPRHPLQVAGARLEHLYSVGPILEGIGLNVTAWSYVDHLDVGVIACRESVPHPEDLCARFPAALDELLAAAPAAAPATPGAPAAPA